MGNIGTAVTSSCAIKSMHRHLALCSQPAATHGEKRRESVEFSCFQSSLTEHRHGLLFENMIFLK